MGFESKKQIWPLKILGRCLGNHIFGKKSIHFKLRGEFSGIKTRDSGREMEIYLGAGYIQPKVPWKETTIEIPQLLDD